MICWKKYEMITVSYSGVHQAYQLALAAQEAGLLDRFLCSFYDAPGKWGHHLSGILGREVLKNRRLQGINPEQVTEHPWPELSFKLRGRFLKLPGNEWINAASQFDRWAARQLRRNTSSGVVCVENCAYETFQVAKSREAIRIYDCPGINAKWLFDTTKEAARRTGLPFVSQADTPEISRRKEVEIELANVVLTYSDVHTQSVVARGVPLERIAQIPLWTDSDFWIPAPHPHERKGPLKVLFAGGINLRKGVPFLVEAVRTLLPHAALTLIGSLDPDAKSCLAGTESFVTVLAPVSKEALRGIYGAHDVLVLPSLGDSFGFVAMEAMACGLPVILTTHCGAPVPRPEWRVPVMNSQVIAERLSLYLDAPNLCVSDGGIARTFAEEFTPLRYRHAIGRICRQMVKFEQPLN
jgi:glycosyltransferase involved in cell wall biosynthesis